MLKMSGQRDTLKKKKRWDSALAIYDKMDMWMRQR